MPTTPDPLMPDEEPLHVRIPMPYPEQPRPVWMQMSNPNPCPDCMALLGVPHMPGCDVARCSVCGFQAIGHSGHANAPQTKWQGEWPGIAECREWGWFDAYQEPDLNRLAKAAAAGLLKWDVQAERWLRRAPSSMTGGGEDGREHRFWIQSAADNRLTVTDVHFATAPETVHISLDGSNVAIRDVTVFAGNLSAWAAIRWGVRGLFRKRRTHRRSAWQGAPGRTMRALSRHLRSPRVYAVSSLVWAIVTVLMFVRGDGFFTVTAALLVFGSSFAFDVTNRLERVERSAQQEES